MGSKNMVSKVVTGLFVVAVLPGAVMNIVQPEVAVEMAGVLGIPLALLTLIGVWKILGVIALLAPPRFDRIREWAYAGFVFDLSGAAYLHAAAGDIAGIAPPLVIMALGVASYVLRRGVGDAPSVAEPEVAASSVSS